MNCVDLNFVHMFCHFLCATNRQVRSAELKSVKHQVGKLVAEHVTVFFKACSQNCEK